LWYSTVGTSILITVMVNMLLTLLPVLVEWPIQLITEKLAPLTSVTQRQLNRSFEGPDFELAARYGVILNNIFSSMLYSAGSPVFYLVAAATCGFTYIADKVSLHYLYKTPTRYNDKLAIFASKILPAAAFMHLGFGIWKYSSVMPMVPVSRAITSSVASAIAQGCETRSKMQPNICAWNCEGNPELQCGHVLQKVLVVNDTVCEVQGWGKCMGNDASLLDFNFMARLLTWSTFPTFMLLSLMVLVTVLRLVLLNPVVRLLIKKCCHWQGCCIPRSLIKTIDFLGIDDDDDDGITYTQAVCLSERSPSKKNTSLPSLRDLSAVHLSHLSAVQALHDPSPPALHVHWNGLHLYGAFGLVMLMLC